LKCVGGDELMRGKVGGWVWGVKPMRPGGGGGAEGIASAVDAGEQSTLMLRPVYPRERSQVAIEFSRLGVF